QSVRDLKELLQNDRDFVKNKDSKEPVPLIHALRELVYGLVDSLGAMFDLLAVRKVEVPKEVSRPNGIPSDERGHQDADTNGVIKEEVMDAHLFDDMMNITVPKDEEEDQLNNVGMDGAVLVAGFESMEDMGREYETVTRYEDYEQRSQEVKRRRVSVRSIRCKSEEGYIPSTNADAHSIQGTPRGLVTPALRRKNACDVCPFIASSPVNLVSHMCSHTGERPFKCPVDNCSTACTSKGNLFRHIGDVHKQCRTCNETFRTAAELKGHIKKEGH
ncbi:hypothetical protein PMAYCL1PPCAC_04408, partial [Pristionchus mayeri]